MKILCGPLTNRACDFLVDIKVVCVYYEFACEGKFIRYWIKHNPLQASVCPKIA